MPEMRKIRGLFIHVRWIEWGLFGTSREVNLVCYIPVTIAATKPVHSGIWPMRYWQNFQCKPYGEHNYLSFSKNLLSLDWSHRWIPAHEDLQSLTLPMFWFYWLLVPCPYFRWQDNKWNQSIVALSPLLNDRLRDRKMTMFLAVSSQRFSLQHNYKC